MVEMWAPLVLVALALALLVGEHLLPTAGALGLLSAACLAAVLYVAFSHSTALGFGYLAAEAVMVPSAFAASSFLATRTKLGRGAYLRPPEAHEVDVSGGLDLGRLVGRQGRALTALRPSGMVDFEGRRLEGMAEAGLIPPGCSITAVRVVSGRLVVRPTLDGPFEGDR